MKIVLRVVVLAALAALGFWLWTILFPSPESVIRQRLGKVAKYASFAANDSNLARLGSARRLACYFSTNAEVVIDTRSEGRHELHGKEQITQAAVASRSAFNNLTVRFLDVDVIVAPDKKSATVELTVDADLSGQPHAIVQEVKITWEKLDGEWLITRAETVRTLS